MRSLLDAWKSVSERSGGGRHLYAVIDCGRDPMIIPPMIEAMAASSECLFRGKARENLGDQAPWAVAVDPNEDLLDWLVEDGFGRRWASFAVSPLGIRDFVSHLRRFTMVEDEAGTLHYFRFYDPQVLRQYLPAFDPDQTARFFRGVDAWLVENSLRFDELLEFTPAGGRTVRRALAIGPVGNKAPAAKELVRT